jgi:S1-C subfamily serine protease
VCAINPTTTAQSSWFFFFLFLQTAFSTGARGHTDKRTPPLISLNATHNSSVVKVYAVTAQPHHFLPWTHKPQREGSGSGFAIAGRQILTNAHVIADQTLVMVRKHGSPAKFLARVAHVAHDW